MKLYIALPPGGIFKVPQLECALDEVVPEYDLMAIADGNPSEIGEVNEMVIIEFCHEFEDMVKKAVKLVYGEPLSEEELS